MSIRIPKYPTKDQLLENDYCGMYEATYYRDVGMSNLTVTTTITGKNELYVIVILDEKEDIDVNKHT